MRAFQLPVLAAVMNLFLMPLSRARGESMDLFLEKNVSASRAYVSLSSEFERV